MAFNDLFSSAKGPSVIGMIMGLIVLLGFGGLAILAFDEGGQGGGKSLAAVIRDNEREIQSGKSRVEIGEITLARVPRMEETSEALAAAKVRNKQLATENSSLGANASVLEKDVTALKEEWEDYKNRYRAHVREGAVGTNMPELRTADGKVFKDVEIRMISAIGIDIRHQEGLGRVNFEQLPEDLQDYYQFDKVQMIAEATREERTRAGLAEAVAKAHEAAEEIADEQRAKDAVEVHKKLIAKIAAKEAQAASIEGQIRQLESEISNAERAAAAARAAGRIHLNKSGSLQQTLNDKRANLVQVRSEIARLSASL